MTSQLEETIKLLMLLTHRAPNMDDASLNRKVDAVVDAYLLGSGAETASRRTELANAFQEKAPATLPSERVSNRIQRGHT